MITKFSYMFRDTELARIEWDHETDKIKSDILGLNTPFERMVPGILGKRNIRFWELMELLDSRPRAICAIKTWCKEEGSKLTAHEYKTLYRLRMNHGIGVDGHWIRFEDETLTYEEAKEGFQVPFY